MCRKLSGALVSMVNIMRFDPTARPAIQRVTFENVDGEGIGVAGLSECIELDEFKNICSLMLLYYGEE